jgi:hypothetical protein
MAMTVSKTLTALLKDILAGMTLYGIGVAMAHGAFIDEQHLCDPTYCDPALENVHESK